MNVRKKNVKKTKTIIPYIYLTADDKIIFVKFIKGGSNVNSELTMPEAVSLKNRGGRVVVVAVGDSINLYELMGMASEPTGSHLFLSTSFDSLFNLVVDTIGATCDGKCNMCYSNLKC